ncbi:hypothetical protein JAAARDRAFT_177256 [Jaapia argillacea MUCL 33604]|uniref:EH domain-containing protein n=1 Tax=Jaapia argillacea MUCL 33604 TaxID=933084 RepID=A0A067PTN5_9AGAM|nr:hypothetical protein JAAARDRAFT_177256 [Jaapia argillacea MUCL 33604]
MTASPTSAELELVDKIFAHPSVETSGYLDGDVAVHIFLDSELPNATLRDVWDLAESSQGGRLSRIETAIAVRLMGWAQAGKTVTKELINTPGPLPYITGVSTPLPPLTSEDKGKFHKIFTGAKPVDGVLDEGAVRALLPKSNLPSERLHQIRSLADPSHSGSFDFPSFCIAMYLVQACMLGKLETVPPIIPRSIREKAMQTGDFNPFPALSSSGISPLRPTAPPKPPKPAPNSTGNQRPRPPIAPKPLLASPDIATSTSTPPRSARAGVVAAAVARMTQAATSVSPVTPSPQQTQQTHRRVMSGPADVMLSRANTVVPSRTLPTPDEDPPEPPASAPPATTSATAQAIQRRLASRSTISSGSPSRAIASPQPPNLLESPLDEEPAPTTSLLASAAAQAVQNRVTLRSPATPGARPDPPPISQHSNQPERQPPDAPSSPAASVFSQVPVRRRRRELVRNRASYGPPGLRAWVQSNGLNRPLQRECDLRRLEERLDVRLDRDDQVDRALHMHFVPSAADRKLAVEEAINDIADAATGMARLSDALFAGFVIRPEWDVNQPLQPSKVEVEVISTRQFKMNPEYKKVLDRAVEVLQQTIGVPHILGYRDRLQMVQPEPGYVLDAHTKAMQNQDVTLDPTVQGDHVEGFVLGPSLQRLSTPARTPLQPTIEEDRLEGFSQDPGLQRLSTPACTPQPPPPPPPAMSSPVSERAPNMRRSSSLARQEALLSSLMPPIPNIPPSTRASPSLPPISPSPPSPPRPTLVLRPPPVPPTPTRSNDPSPPLPPIPAGLLHLHDSHLHRSLPPTPRPASAIPARRPTPPPAPTVVRSPSLGGSPQPASPPINNTNRNQATHRDITPASRAPPAPIDTNIRRQNSVIRDGDSRNRAPPPINTRTTDQTLSSPDGDWVHTPLGSPTTPIQRLPDLPPPDYYSTDVTRFQFAEPIHQFLVECGLTATGFARIDEVMSYEPSAWKFGFEDAGLTSDQAQHLVDIYLACLDPDTRDVVETAAAAALLRQWDT